MNEKEMIFQSVCSKIPLLNLTIVNLCNLHCDSNGKRDYDEQFGERTHIYPL